MNKTCVITGITGQDGSFLTEFLLNKNYIVHGIIRRHSVTETQTTRIQHLFDRIKLHYGDILDISSLINVFNKVKPDEIYHLAAQSHVGISFQEPIYTVQTIVNGTLNLLEAMKLIVPNSKLYNAASSEMFGNSIDADGYQRETTIMNPASPYGAAKLFAYSLVRNYRKSYNMFLSNGILFNHESPVRGENFVTNKIVKCAVEIALGLKTELKLGNLNARRDWGHAKDYTELMWKILQHHKPDDFVCATGISRSVLELVEYVFNQLDLDYDDYVVYDETQIRPEDISVLCGDSTKAKNLLRWEPTYTFGNMLDEMIEYWLEKYKYAK